jgi:Bacterial RNA polymerase, alpha chain C terminal domain
LIFKIVWRLKASSKDLRTCSKGHKYYKSSDCPVCPICENERKPADGFLSTLSAPARRALEREGINTLLKLSKFSETELLKLHGMGPGSIPKLKLALKERGLSFRKK